MRLSSLAVDHPAIVIILTIALVLAGILSVLSLTQEFLPNVALPSIIVLTTYPGVDASTIESNVTSILEDAFITLQGLDGIESESRDSVSLITMEFVGGIDVYDMLPEVRAAIDRSTGDLPSELERKPYAFVGGAGMLPIFSVVLTSAGEPEMIAELVTQRVIPSIAKIEGTAEVLSYGTRTRELVIDLNRGQLEALGLSASEILQVIRSSEVNIPAGSVDYRGEQLYLSTRTEYRSLEQLEHLVVAARGERLVRLGDIATLTFGYPSPELYIDTLGGSAVIIDVTKRDDGDTIYIAGRIHALLDELSREFGDSVDFTILSDDSQLISSSLATTIRSGALGALMAVLVILLFLFDLRATIVIALSIPLSILFTFLGMRLASQSLNILSTAGIIVALGMVVDSSIVILENIFRLEHGGLTMRRAAKEGAREVGSAVFASGATTIAVFIPLLFLSGIIGIIMTDISLTILFALASSLLVAMAIVPFLASRLKYMKGRRQRVRKRSTPSLFTRVERGYAAILSFSLKKPALILSLSLMILILSVGFIALLGVVFIPSADTGECYLYMEFPSGYDIDRTHQKVEGIRELVTQSTPELRTALFCSGYGNEYARSFIQPNRAYAKLILTPGSTRERSVLQIMEDLQSRIMLEVSDVSLVVENGGFDSLLAIATGGSGVQIELLHSDQGLLYETAQALEEFLQDDPEVYKAQLDVRMDSQTLYRTIDLRKAGELGVSASKAAFEMRILSEGVEAGTFKTEKREYPIRLSSADGDQSILQDQTIISEAGKTIRFDQFSQLELSERLSVIRHSDRINAITVTGYTHQQDTTAIVERVKEYLMRESAFQQVEARITGSSSLLTNSLTTLVLVLGLSLFLVYMVMVIQFERFLDPLLIMASVPFCVAGVALGLLLFGSEISLIAFLGLIALGGIVVNNAIVLIDTIRRSEGPTLEQRVVTSCVIRLRPILMTSLTTLFGVLPMALSTGDGSEIYAPLGQAIAGGLLSSTLITLILIPTVFLAVETRRSKNETKDTQ